jgi:hypothetical protein
MNSSSISPKNTGSAKGIEPVNIAVEMGMSSAGSADPGNTEPGTFQLWTEGTVIIKMKNGGEYAATFRQLTPNQFDLVDSENGAVTVFKIGLVS